LLSYFVLLTQDTHGIETRITSITLDDVKVSDVNTALNRTELGIHFTIHGELWNPSYHPVGIKDYKECNDKPVRTMIKYAVFDDFIASEFNGRSCDSFHDERDGSYQRDVYQPGITKLTFQSGIGVLLHGRIDRPVGNFSLTINDYYYSYTSFSVLYFMGKDSDSTVLDPTPPNWGKTDSNILPYSLIFLGSIIIGILDIILYTKIKNRKNSKILNP